MLTNPYETQLVQSLGVRIGPADVEPSRAGERLRKGGPAVASAAIRSRDDGRCQR